MTDNKQDEPTPLNLDGAIEWARGQRSFLITLGIVCKLNDVEHLGMLIDACNALKELADCHSIELMLNEKINSINDYEASWSALQSRKNTAWGNVFKICSLEDKKTSDEENYARDWPQDDKDKFYEQLSIAFNWKSGWKEIHDLTKSIEYLEKNIKVAKMIIDSPVNDERKEEYKIQLSLHKPLLEAARSQLQLIGDARKDEK